MVAGPKIRIPSDWIASILNPFGSIRRKTERRGPTLQCIIGVGTSSGGSIVGISRVTDAGRLGYGGRRTRGYDGGERAAAYD